MLTRLATFAMGTRFELVIECDDDSFARAVGEEAIEEIQRWHQALNYFSPDSLVSNINRRAASVPVPMDDESFALLRLCERVWDASHGAFDITIAPLMHQWGFRDTVLVNPSLVLEGRSESRCRCGFEHVRLDTASRSIAYEQEDIAIDLGAVAKGWALDRARDVLLAHGIATAFLHGGTSSAVGIGCPPDKYSGWPVAIHTHSPEHRPVVSLLNRALSVSGSHGRTVDSGKARLGHIMDPRSASPAQERIAAVSSRSAALADAWSTAMLVLGEVPDSVLGDIQPILLAESDCSACDSRSHTSSKLMCNSL